MEGGQGSGRAGRVPERHCAVMGYSWNRGGSALLVSTVVTGGHSEIVPPPALSWLHGPLLRGGSYEITRQRAVCFQKVETARLGMVQ